MKVAALYVDAAGIYAGLPNVDTWDVQRDARCYGGPYPVVAHPPCERWCRYWHGSPIKPHVHQRGDDKGCFAAALACVRVFGGVLEHPAYSSAWLTFSLQRPLPFGGWVVADTYGGWTCQVEQGHYGHVSRKVTWLYAVDTCRPRLNWCQAPQRIDPVALKRYGYERARRTGVLSMVDGSPAVKKQRRGATPVRFRNLLIRMALSCYVQQEEAEL